MSKEINYCQGMTKRMGDVCSKGVRISLTLLLVLAAAAIVDVIMFLTTMEAPNFHKIELFLESPSSESKQYANMEKKSAFDTPATSNDVVMTAKGTMRARSFITSPELKSVYCSVSAFDDSSSRFETMAEVSVVNRYFHNCSDSTCFHLTLETRDIDPHVVRKLIWTLHSKATTMAQAKFDCNVQLQLHYFHLMSKEVSFSISKTVDLKKSKSSKSVGDHVMGELIKYSGYTWKDYKTKSSSRRLTKYITPTIQNFTASHIGIDIAAALTSITRKKLKALNVMSMVVNLPKIKYAISLVDKANKEQNYLILRSQQASFDLMSKSPLNFKLDMKCINSLAPGNHSACALFRALDILQFSKEFRNNFVNITATAMKINFISSILGERHYIRTIDPSSPRASNYIDNAFATSASSVNALARHLSTQYADPSVSSGPNCMIVDSDGVYITDTCLYIEKGFFELALTIYDNSGGIGNIKTTTSWSPYGPVAFDFQLDATIMSSGTENILTSRFLFSENFQNLSFTSQYNQSNSVLFNENIVSRWNFDPKSLSGLIYLYSYSFVSGYAPYIFTNTFVYEDNNYHLWSQLSQSTSTIESQIYYLQAYGKYGGTLEHW